MKRLPLLLSILSLTLSFTPARSDEAPADGAQGELSLPWTAFEKLLKLNQDNVVLTWDEFQRLVKQTGVAEMPAYQVQNGNVVLTRAEFKRLLDLMKAPAGEAAKYFLTKAVYTGRIGKKSTTVTAKIRLQVMGKGADVPPVRIPLFPGVMAFQDILLDGRPALIENDGNTTYVTTTKPGEQEIVATFSTQSSLEKEPFQLSFNTPQTPITQLDFFLPLANVDVNVTNASQVESLKAEGGTRVRANLPQTGSITMTWNGVEPEKEKGPAKIYSVIHNLLSVEEDALRVTARIELDVLQNTVNTLNIQVPEGYTLLDVQGESVGEWKMREGSRVLVVPFQFARKGRFDLTLTAEQVLKEKSSVAVFSGFQVLTAVRESGFVGVELKTTAEAKILENPGLSRLDAQELPASLTSLTPRPLIYGFKYARPPFHLNLDIQKHEEVAVISTVVDEANGVTLVLDDGKRVHHMTFTVRNTWKQFLELQLPADAQVWTAFVDGQRVKPSKNDAGKVLIPLNRSKSENGDLSSFDVELMYYQGRNGLAPLGRETLEFPIPDVVVSQLLWSVYLPTKNDYLYFGGTVDKEKAAEGFRPLLSAAQGKRRVLDSLQEAAADTSYLSSGQTGKDVKMARIQKAKTSAQYLVRSEFGESQGVNEEAYSRQVERELNFFSNVGQQAVAGGSAGGGEAGVLPIRVKVPNSGQVFRFSKLIINEPKPLVLDVIYVHRWLVGLTKLLILLGLLRLLYGVRAALKQAVQKLKELSRGHEKEIQWALSPMGSTVTAFGLMVVMSFVSRLLAVMAFLLLVGTALRWGWLAFAAKRENR